MRDPNDYTLPEAGLMAAMGVFGLIGGAVTVVGLWPYGMPLALMGAPVGGSLTALVASLLLLAWHRDPDKA